LILKRKEEEIWKKSKIQTFSIFGRLWLQKWFQTRHMAHTYSFERVISITLDWIYISVNYVYYS
jgi:hypothetical protein